MASRAQCAGLHDALVKGGLILMVGGDGGKSWPIGPYQLYDVLAFLADGVLNAPVDLPPPTLPASDLDAVPEYIDSDPTAPYPSHVATALPRASVIIAWDQLNQ